MIFKAPSVRISETRPQNPLPLVPSPPPQKGKFLTDSRTPPCYSALDSRAPVTAGGAAHATRKAVIIASDHIGPRPHVTERPRRPAHFPKPTEWKTPYEAALRDLDPARLKDSFESARRAIVDRILELAHNAADEKIAAEREELAEASRVLALRERNLI